MHLAIMLTAPIISASSLVLVIWLGRRTARYNAEARQSWVDARQSWAQFVEPTEQQVQEDGEQR